MFHLAHTETKRKSANCPLRRSMAVATGNRVARLRKTQFRANDVNDSLKLALQIEQADAPLMCRIA